MKKTNGTLSAIGGFFKRNAVYIILTLCIIAIGISITLILVNNANSSISDNVNTTDDMTPVPEPEKVADPVINPSEDEKPAPQIVSFTMPVESYDSVAMYNDSMVFNSTLKRYSTHKAMDFFADEGTKVFCVYDGVVESIDNELLTGITVTINHGNGLKTIYNSLAESDVVQIGQTLKKGDLIGTMSTTNRQEYKEGAHLHFETIESGANINPEKYLSLNNK